MGGVHLEFDVHLTEAAQYDEAFNKIGQNDLSGSLWHDNVTSRMATYSPDFVVSDGCNSLESLNDTQSTDASAPRPQERLQLCVPPNLSTVLDKPVMLVGGDAYTVDRTLAATSQEISMRYLQKYLRVGAAFMYGGVGLDILHNLTGWIREIEARSTEPLLIDPLSNDTPDTIVMPFESKHISRRFIMKGFFAGLIGSRALDELTRIPVHSGTHAFDWLYALNEKLTHGYMPSTPQTQWVNGRTALLIQKGIEIADAYDAEVGVVMGNGHVINANKYMDDQEARYTAIRNLISLLLLGVANVHKEMAGLSANESISLTVGAFTGIRLFYTDSEGPDSIRIIDTHTSSVCEELLHEALNSGLKIEE